MNIGTGSNVESSGERYALSYIKEAEKSKSSILVFDVGANVGDFVYSTQEIIGQSAKIFCFEPKKTTFEKLQKKVQGNINVNLFNFGFGDKKGSLTLFFDQDPEKSGMASVYQRKLDHFNVHFNGQEIIQITTIDEFCSENSIKLIDFLKMDVEGHEINVLKGANKMIEADAIHFILFEFGGCNIDSKTYFQDFFYFFKNKYQIFRILQDGLYPIREYQETDEIFITTNFLAVHNCILKE